MRLNSGELKPTHWLDIRDKEELEVPADSVSYGDISHKEDRYHTIPLFEIPYATGSDYSGGLVTRSNYEVIQEMAKEDEELADFLVDTYGGHGTYGLFIRLDLEDEVPQELIDVVGALEQYPLLNDEHHGNLEMEAEDEAWDSWGRSDFHRALEKSHLALDHEELIEDLTDEQLDALWRKGAESHGSGGVEHTDEGPHFYFDAVAKNLDEEDLLEVQAERMKHNPTKHGYFVKQADKRVAGPFDTQAEAEKTAAEFRRYAPGSPVHISSGLYLSEEFEEDESYYPGEDIDELENALYNEIDEFLYEGHPYGGRGDLVGDEHLLMEWYQYPNRFSPDDTPRVIAILAEAKKRRGMKSNPQTGMTAKGKRMYESVKASGSAYAPSAVVYGAAKRGAKGLVTSQWAKEHGYPKPNPSKLFRHIEEIAEETGREMPVYEDLRKNKYRGYVIESWYDEGSSYMYPWGAFAKGIGSGSGETRQAAIEAVKKKINKEHGYPKPNPLPPVGGTAAYRREEMTELEEQYGLDPYFPTDPMDARGYLQWLKSGEEYFEGFDE